MPSSLQNFYDVFLSILTAITFTQRGLNLFTCLPVRFSTIAFHCVEGDKHISFTLQHRKPNLPGEIINETYKVEGSSFRRPYPYLCVPGPKHRYGCNQNRRPSRLKGIAVENFTRHCFP